MRNEYTRYFFGFLVAIGLIILVIFLLVQGGGTSTKKVPNTPKALTSFYNTDTVVRLTVDGPVTAPENHRKVEVTVGRDQATYQLFEGYDGAITTSQSFANTQNSYDVFLHALSHAGFTQGNTDKALVNSAGFCPAGRVYTFEVIEGSKDLQNFWATSCGNPKTYGGSLSTTLALFRAQIPQYDALTRDIRF